MTGYGASRGEVILKQKAKVAFCLAFAAADEQKEFPCCA
jgi:hypothetical protein